MTEETDGPTHEAMRQASKSIDVSAEDRKSTRLNSSHNQI